MKDKECIYFQKCSIYSIGEEKYLKKLLKNVRVDNTISLIINNYSNNASVEQEIFQCKDLQLKNIDVIYNSNSKERSQKSIKNKKVYSLKINKDNINIIKKFIKSVYQTKEKNNNISSLILSKEGKAYFEIDFEHDDIIINGCNIKIKYILLCVLSIIFLIIILKMFFTIIVPNNNHITIGIIDGAYTQNIDGVVYNCEHNLLLKEETHGDKMVKFAKQVSNNVKIYYYDASNEQGVIDTENLLQALEYMKEQGVNRICLSISSKKYSADLDEWFKNNTNIKVYASYNNLINSKDYPAMYDNVYGCGKKVDIKYKDIDYTYLNNSIIILPNIFKIYKGNSYLSLYNALNN